MINSSCGVETQRKFYLNERKDTRYKWWERGFLPGVIVSINIYKSKLRVGWEQNQFHVLSLFYVEG